LRELLAVEVGHLAGADDVELQDLEALPNVVCDLRLGEIDEMRLLAIGAAAQLPHDGEALALLGAGREIVGQLEEAFEKPGLALDAVVGQDGLRPRAACAECDQSAGGTCCEE